jgi:hypothetical protein
MEDNLSVSDLFSLKNLLNEPLYLIKEEFNAPLEPLSAEEASIAKPETDNKLFTYKGQNLKKIVFIVFIEDAEIASIDKVLYAKTLAALKLTDDDVALCVSNTSHAHQYETISTEFPKQKIICFAGTEHYKDELLSVKSEYDCKFLLCPSLSELQLNQDLKIKWWNVLKAFISE